MRPAPVGAARHDVRMSDPVFRWTHDTPWGVVSVGATSSFVHGVRLRARGARRPLDTSAPAAVRELEAAFARYFAGDGRALRGVPIDLSGAETDFHRRVLTLLHEAVGPGQTVSYGELAEMAGHPGAARAVGTAMARNPVPVVVPCHRVLAAGGRIGGYGGGLDMKRGLLALEAGLATRSATA